MKSEEVDSLMAAFGSAEPAWAIKAAARTYRLGLEAAAVVSGLGRNLEHPNPNVVAWSAIALGQMGEVAASSIPSLLSLLTHQHRFVRASVAAALGKLNAEQSVASLVSCLRDPEREVRAAAAKALLRIASSDALAALRSTHRTW